MSRKIKIPDDPKFSQEQLAWLQHQMRIECCHTSGTHDPVHFQEKKYICSDQLAHVYKRLLKILGFKTVEVCFDPECGWCEEYPEYKAGVGRARIAYCCHCKGGDGAIKYVGRLHTCWPCIHSGKERREKR